ncbi:MAG TPA: ATP-binding protein [Patescibacteria group bacterium]|nr:ATP-binding protein [Patescibacteria group bacterium]
MIHLSAILAFAAAGFLLALALAHTKRKPRRPQVMLFIFSAFLLAAIEITVAFLVLARTPEGVLGAFSVLLPSLIFLPAVGLPFFMTFGRRNDREILSENLKGIITLGVLLVVAAFIVPPRLVIEKIHFAEGGPFWGMTLSGFGKGIGVYVLLVNVFFLFYFENTYRAANVPEKVTLKYPFLGILAASVINFIVMSRLVALSVIDINFMAIQSCGIIMICATFLFATVRYRLFDVKAYISREVASSVVTVIIAGLYLLALALISYLTAALGVPFDRLTLIVLGIFAVFILLAVSISGRARMRLRHFVNENFYLNTYDYRKEWRKYAHLMASSTSIDELSSNLISTVCETIAAQQGFVRIAVRGGITAYYGITADAIDDALVARVMRRSSEDAVIIAKDSAFDATAGTETEPGTHMAPDGTAEPGTGGDRGARSSSGDWIGAVAYLGAGDECRGFIALGPKHMNTSYSYEDREFLATIADQALLSIENLIMEERIIESNQMESFNRFASFVVHDLKNTVGMLSMTAENARENIHDADFQRDAIGTIKRSVEKMQQLIDSLNTHTSPGAIRRTRIDITTLIEQAVQNLGAIAASRHVSVITGGGRGILAEVDPTALRRVIENLVLNAIEATPEGGRIEIDAGERGAHDIEFVVRDTGTGFDPGYLHTDLFRPFRSTKKDGLGIGLILCKSLVEAHGGALSIESEPGRGAAVRVSLPAGEDPA